MKPAKEVIYMHNSELGLAGIMATWGWRIKRASLRQTSFAEEIGVSPAVLSEYISGKKIPSLKRFELIENEIRKRENGADNDSL